MERSRRGFLKLCVATASVASLKATGIADASLSMEVGEEPDVEQARYVAKSADRRAEIYEDLSMLFDAVEREELQQDFIESIKPSVASLVPGTVGDMLDLVDTVKWYDEVSEDSGLHAVSQAGVIKEPTSQADAMQDGMMEGGTSRAMEGARTELQQLSERAKETRDEAEKVMEDPSDWSGVLNALSSERSAIDDIRWLREWTKIYPDEYDTLHPYGDEAAEEVKNNAEGVLAVTDGFGSLTENQHQTVQNGDMDRFPKLIAGFNQQIDGIGGSVLVDTATGDTFNLIIEKEDGGRLYKRWLNTDSNGEVHEYKLVPGEANADITMSESDLQELMNADDYLAKAKRMYNQGEISVEGNGFSWLTYGGAKLGYGIVQGIAGAANAVGNFVGDIAEGVRNLF